MENENISNKKESEWQKEISLIVRSSSIDSRWDYFK
jgi:hypothetical protein